MRRSAIRRPKRILALGLTAIVAMVVSWGIAGGTAHAAAGNFNISPRATGWLQCLDIASNNPGTTVGLYYCNPNSTNTFLSQQWWWNYVSNDHALVESASSGYHQCWDVRSYAAGTLVGLNTCNPGLASQWWDHFNYTLISVGSGRRMCLDLRSYAAGTPIGLNDCKDTPSQKFNIRGTS